LQRLIELIMEEDHLVMVELLVVIKKTIILSMKRGTIGQGGVIKTNLIRGGQKKPKRLRWGKNIWIEKAAP